MTSNDTSMKTAHLASALAALALLAALIGGAALYAQRIEADYVRALAPVDFSQKYLGSALQRAAFQQRDLLPVYGSSELLVQKPYQEPYRAVNLFRGEPTGFTIFPLGHGDTTDLVLLQRLAAVGSGLRGKKVVISLSPTWFFERLQEPHHAYAGNFSRLDAGAVIFNTALSYGLKRDVARRMRDYPDTLARDSLLRFAVVRLINDTPTDRALYYLALPLGMLQNLVLRLQDHWEILSYIWSHPEIAPAAPARARPIDWAGLLAAARVESARQTDNNPLHFDNGDWASGYRSYVAAQRGTMSDAEFLAGLRRAREWNDLELLLRTVRELGGRPLVLSMPIGGTYYGWLGVSPQARAQYYAKVRGLAEKYGTAERDFAEHDQDPYFVLDARGHMLPAGWVYYDQALDDFYHGRPLR